MFPWCCLLQRSRLGSTHTHVNCLHSWLWSCWTVQALLHPLGYRCGHEENKLSRLALALYTWHRVYMKYVYVGWCEKCRFTGQLCLILHPEKRFCSVESHSEEQGEKVNWFRCWFIPVFRLWLHRLHAWCVATACKWSIMSVVKWWIMSSHFPSGDLKSQSVLKVHVVHGLTELSPELFQLMIEWFHWRKLFSYSFLIIK